MVTFLMSHFTGAKWREQETIELISLQRLFNMLQLYSKQGAMKFFFATENKICL